MHAMTGAVSGLLLLLAACGGRAVPPAPPSEGTPPVAAGASESAPAAPAHTEGPEKGGDEVYLPPPDWCGTPGMWRQPFPDPGEFAWFTNERGEVLHVPLDELTAERLAELEREGWTLRWKVGGTSVK